jgi:riboflavin synthase
MRYVVEKGFIAVDGTSLTVVHCDRDEFVITIIPFTRENTVLGSRAVGDIVNVEVDILAKYVERLSSGARGEAAGR